MSNAALNWAFAQRTGSPGERLVLLVLADAANNSGLAWPSQVTIAAKSGLCRREVQYVLKGLRQRELVTPLGYNKRRRVYHLNHASKPMFGEDDKRTPLRKSKAHSTAHDDLGKAQPTAQVTSAIYDKDRRTPLRTNPRKNPKGETPSALRPSVDDPGAVVTDGRTDRQGMKKGLTPSGQRLARWVDHYVPRVAAGNGFVGEVPSKGGTFVGAERLIRLHGTRRVLSVIRGMSEERELGDGYYLCWERSIKSPAEYLAWYLKDG